jgi:hypothetical protein
VYRIAFVLHRAGAADVIAILGGVHLAGALIEGEANKVAEASGEHLVGTELVSLAARLKVGHSSTVRPWPAQPRRYTGLTS